MKKSSLSVLAVCFVVAGCATITQGTRQNIQFDSKPRGATCDILKDNTIYWSSPEGADEYIKAANATTEDDDLNRIWRKGFVVDEIPKDTTILYENILTPSNLELEKSKFLMVISCQKDGKQKIISIAPKINLWMAGNIILGGPLGVLIDAASGADAYYPSRIVVDLESSE